MSKALTRWLLNLVRLLYLAFLFVKHSIYFSILGIGTWAASADRLVETAKLYGGGLKYWPVWNHMSQINGHAKALREAYDSGIDPITIVLDETTAARGRQSNKSKGSGHSLNDLCPISFLVVQHSTAQFPCTWFILYDKHNVDLLCSSFKEYGIGLHS
jgi:hypothetical protein